MPYKSPVQTIIFGSPEKAIKLTKRLFRYLGYRYPINQSK